MMMMSKMGRVGRMARNCNEILRFSEADYLIKRSASSSITLVPLSTHRSLDMCLYQLLTNHRSVDLYAM